MLQSIHDSVPGDKALAVATLPGRMEDGSSNHSYDSFAAVWTCRAPVLLLTSFRTSKAAAFRCAAQLVLILSAAATA